MVSEVQHPLLLLLPPLLPLMARPVPHLHVAILVLVGPIVNPDTKLVHVREAGDTILLIELDQGGGQSLHLL